MPIGFHKKNLSVLAEGLAGIWRTADTGELGQAIDRFNGPTKSTLSLSIVRAVLAEGKVLNYL